ASSADTASNRCAGIRSASVSTADPNAPITKPICTDMVSHALPDSSSAHAVVSAGTTAEAENHTAITSSSASDSSRSARHLPGICSTGAGVECRAAPDWLMTRMGGRSGVVQPHTKYAGAGAPVRIRAAASLFERDAKAIVLFKRQLQRQRDAGGFASRTEQAAADRLVWLGKPQLEGLVVVQRGQV